MTPRRHQRPKMGHLAGWRKPAGAVLICRPSKWGNPHPIGKPCPVPICDGVAHDRDGAVDAFENNLVAGILITGPKWEPLGIEDARRDLAGKDVVCACGLDKRCHGDVLLKWANSEEG